MGIIHKFDEQKVELNVFFIYYFQIEEITSSTVTVSIKTDNQS